MAYDNRFDGSKLLALNRGIIVENKEMGLSDDGSFVLMWENLPPASLTELKNWAKENRRTIDGKDVDYQHVEGVHRSVEIQTDTKNKTGLLYHRFAKGLYTELDWTSARLVEHQTVQAGTDTNALDTDMFSATQVASEQYLIVDLPNLKRGKADTIKSGLSASYADVVKANGESKSGTWYVIDAVSGTQQDDGAERLRLILTTNSKFAVQGFSGKDGYKATYEGRLYGLRKAVAQTIIDTYYTGGTRGMQVIPSYGGEKNLVDLSISKLVDDNGIILASQVTSSDCRYLVETTFYIDVASDPALPEKDAQAGITYSKGAVRVDPSSGRYTTYIEKRTRLYQHHAKTIVDDNEYRKIEEEQHLGSKWVNAAAEGDPASYEYQDDSGNALSIPTEQTESNPIINVDYKVNADCTTDIVVRWTTLKQITNKTTRKGHLFDEVTTLLTELDADDVNLVDQGTMTDEDGKIVTVSHETSESGKTNQTKTERTPEYESKYVTFLSRYGLIKIWWGVNATTTQYNSVISTASMDYTTNNRVEARVNDAGLIDYTVVVSPFKVTLQDITNTEASENKRLVRKEYFYPDCASPTAKDSEIGAEKDGYTWDKRVEQTNYYDSGGFPFYNITIILRLTKMVTVDWYTVQDGTVQKIEKKLLLGVTGDDSPTIPTPSDSDGVSLTVDKRKAGDNSTDYECTRATTNYRHEPAYVVRDDESVKIREEKHLGARSDGAGGYTDDAATPGALTIPEENTAVYQRIEVDKREGPAGTTDIVIVWTEPKHQATYEEFVSRHGLVKVWKGSNATSDDFTAVKVAADLDYSTNNRVDENENEFGLIDYTVTVAPFKVDLENVENLEGSENKRMVRKEWFYPDCASPTAKDSEIGAEKDGYTWDKRVEQANYYAADGSKLYNITIILRLTKMVTVDWYTLADDDGRKIEKKLILGVTADDVATLTLPTIGASAGVVTEGVKRKNSDNSTDYEFTRTTEYDIQTDINSEDRYHTVDVEEHSSAAAAESLPAYADGSNVEVQNQPKPNGRIATRVKTTDAKAETTDSWTERDDDRYTEDMEEHHNATSVPNAGTGTNAFEIVKGQYDKLGKAHYRKRTVTTKLPDNYSYYYYVDAPDDQTWSEYYGWAPTSAASTPSGAKQEDKDTYLTDYEPITRWETESVTPARYKITVSVTHHRTRALAATAASGGWGGAPDVRRLAYKVYRAVKKTKTYEVWNGTAYV